MSALLSDNAPVETRGKARVASTVAARAHLLRRALQAASPTESVAHAMEVRALLEPSMARLAAERATPQDLEAIERFLGLMETSPDAAELMIEYDAGFHVSIARATGNPTLIHMVSAIADALAATRRLSLHARSGPETSIAGHHAIVDALRRPDPDLAEAAMRQHFHDVARLITESGARSP